jgi:hypothetical protein
MKSFWDSVNSLIQLEEDVTLQKLTIEGEDGVSFVKS